MRMLLVLVAIVVGWSAEAGAQGCDDPLLIDLMAGKTTDVGAVAVCNDEDTLTVTYETIYPWCLLKTDLHAALTEPGIPQNRPGNPIPGDFDYGTDHDCVGEASFVIDLDDIEDGTFVGDTVAIAAHAEVSDGVLEEGAWGAGTRFVQRGNWATWFEYEIQEEDLSCPAGNSTFLGGVEVGGHCWYRVDPGLAFTCDSVCAGAGLVYSEATRTYAGSDGTNQQCRDVLDALGILVGVTVQDQNCGTALGCGARSGFSPGRLRCLTPATTSAAASSSFSRACACTAP